ncbi:uncharacterized protein LOC113367923 [Ctenocephalides felis]|uniref:uncharacterized protein LOC113367923 n=1 Tax=Ctenocephalides felis TaxID=7515 RepID=UPI000E6E36A6|nr:uncharacterized protein LOC113367923 [Ctenocephalides felis]
MRLFRKTNSQEHQILPQFERKNSSSSESENGGFLKMTKSELDLRYCHKMDNRIKNPEIQKSGANQRDFDDHKDNKRGEEKPSWRFGKTYKPNDNVINVNNNTLHGSKYNTLRNSIHGFEGFDKSKQIGGSASCLLYPSSDNPQNKSTIAEDIRRMFSRTSSMGLLVTNTQPQNFQADQQINLEPSNPLYRSLSTSQLTASSYIRCDDPTDGVFFNQKKDQKKSEGSKICLQSSEGTNTIRRKSKASSCDDLAAGEGIEDTSHQQQVQFKRANFPYAFLRSSKLSALPEEDCNQQMLSRTGRDSSLSIRSEAPCLRNKNWYPEHDLIFDPVMSNRRRSSAVSLDQSFAAASLFANGNNLNQSRRRCSIAELGISHPRTTDQDVLRPRRFSTDLVLDNKKAFVRTWGRGRTDVSSNESGYDSDGGGGGLKILVNSNNSNAGVSNKASRVQDLDADSGVNEGSACSDGSSLHDSESSLGTTVGEVLDFESRITSIKDKRTRFRRIMLQKQSANQPLGIRLIRMNEQEPRYIISKIEQGLVDRDGRLEWVMKLFQ